MDQQEWRQIVAKLGASYPGQELRPETAVEWFEELREYPAERVWRAVRRCRRDQSFRPTLAELLDAMLLNAQERAAEPSDRLAIEARDPDSPGVPPPPEYKAARERMLASVRLPEPKNGRSRDKQLAELEAMMARDAAEGVAFRLDDPEVVSDTRPTDTIQAKGGRL